MNAMAKTISIIILLLCAYFRLSAQPNIVLVGIKHPYYPKDDKTMPQLADSLNRKCAYVDVVYPFSSGTEVLSVLQSITRQYGKVGNVVMYGHSGYEGYFVRQNMGFHRDQYYYSQKRKGTPLSRGGALVATLRELVQKRQIVFDSNAVMVLAGCNTAYGEENIALDLADALNIPVAGSNQKVDLYNVGNKGEEMRGTEAKTFFIYFPLEAEIVKYDLQTPTIDISRIFRIAQAKRILLQTKYTSCVE